MTKLVFLLEERSMAEMLRIVIPRLLPGTIEKRDFILIPHNGKSELEKSIPRKLRGWNEPGVRFIVVRDKDQADCRSLKKRLTDLCSRTGRHDTLVRIAVHHLESWYLGDLRAIAEAYAAPAIAKRQSESKFQDPDRLSNAIEEIQKLVPEFQKIAGARSIAPHLELSQNRSTSFRVFAQGVTDLWRGRR